MESRKIKSYPSFKKVNYWERVLRKFSLKLKIFTNIWYGEWKNYLSTVETVIIFATNRFDYIQFIADKYPNLRIIVWYWNPVFRCFEPDCVRGKNIEFWSFDKEDCKNYKLHFNSTFYFNDLPIKQKDKKWDLIFLGADKGRADSILIFESKINKHQINTHFIIVPDKGSANPKNIQPLNYRDYINLIGQSKGIFDFIQEGQAGLTLRPMESIFFKKKLITNDRKIVEEPFYNPSNILVLNDDNYSRIPDFINSPYCELSKEIIEYYEFSNWLKRFDEI